MSPSQHSENWPPPRGQWKAWGHAERYALLQRVRLEHCSAREQAKPRLDRESAILELDGEAFGDVPGFLLALGEAVNGARGYFGGSLDALSDCLCGGFGLGVNATVVIRKQRVARAKLDCLAWDRFYAETYHTLSQDDMSEDELANMGYLGNGSAEDRERWKAIHALLRRPDTQSAELASHGYVADASRNYFEVACNVLEEGGVKVVLGDS